jgi:type VI secretion system secreted protein VgrG
MVGQLRLGVFCLKQTQDFSMSTRTFILHTPLDPEQLKFVEMHGNEALSDVFEFDVQCVSPSDEIDAKDLLGQNVTVEVITQDGSSRYLNGIVSDFAYIGPDGSAGRRYKYEMKLRSWLWLADKTSDCRIYQRLDVPSIIQQALAGFSMPLEMKLMDNYGVRDYVVQYQETTLNFVKRLAEEVGLYFYVRHDLGLHTIVFTDGGHTTLPEYAQIPFLTPSLRTMTAEEYVKEWRVQHQVKSGSFSASSYNFKAPSANLQQSDGNSKGHSNDSFEIYEWSGAYVERDDGAKRVSVRSEQQQLDFQTITAQSNARGVAPGYYFKLTNHPNRAYNAEYLITSANYWFRENSDATGTGDDVTTWNIEFIAKPSNERYQPPRATIKPHIVGPQTALVTGPAGQEVWTNEYGQIKVYFYWDRHSGRDENSSCWIRVASSWAGSNWGEVMIPRIGQEVIIEHLDGDPDRPIAVGRVNNANQMPSSFSSSGGLPSNQTLAGIKSKEFQGNRYNQLLFDDTSGEIRTQLESEHAKSQLNLGFLTHPRSGKAEPRGEGFELRTDAWGALRAANGLLLSSAGRDAGEGNALSRDELVYILQQALNLAKSMGDFASDHQGNKSDPKPQKDLHDAIESLGYGSNAEKGDNGGQPVVAVSGHAGIAFGSPKDITVASGQHIDQVAQRNQHITAGDQLNLHAGRGISQFAVEGGIKSIANKGKHVTQSQNDDVQLIADQSVVINASHDHVMVTADKHITLMSGGGYIKIANGNIELHCPGTIDMKSGNYKLAGPANAKPDPITSKYEGPHAISILAHSAEGVALEKATATFYDGTKGTKITEEPIGGDGTTAKVNADHNQIYNALVGYPGWSTHFAIDDGSDEDGEDFEPGDLDEDRHLERT